jgi:hypothetical protein
MTAGATLVTQSWTLKGLPLDSAATQLCVFGISTYFRAVQSKGGVHGEDFLQDVDSENLQPPGLLLGC